MTTSDRLTEMYRAQSTGEVLVPMMRLAHPEWSEDLYVTGNGSPVTFGGEVYSPFPFKLILPDQDADVLPILKLTAQNVSQELIVAFRGVTDNVEVEAFWAIVSGTVSKEIGSYDVILYGIEYDDTTITGTLTVEPILEQAYGHLVMNPLNTPGIF